MVRRRIRAETRGVIVPAGDPAFARHVAARRAATGAPSTSTCSARRSSATPRPTPASTALSPRIAGPDVDYVSVKISALCANLDVLAFDHAVERIAERLRTVYRAPSSARRRCS